MHVACFWPGYNFFESMFHVMSYLLSLQNASLEWLARKTIPVKLQAYPVLYFTRVLRNVLEHFRFTFLQKKSFVREFFKKQICFRVILQNKFKNENSFFVPHVMMERISLPLNLKSMKFFNEKESFTLKDFVERIF